MINERKIRDICHFRSEDGELDQAAIARVAVSEVYEFLGKTMARDYGALLFRKVVPLLRYGLGNGKQMEVHELIQLFYGWYCPGEELEGLYMALEDQEVADRFYPLFLNTLESAAYLAVNTIEVNGGDADEM